MNALRSLDFTDIESLSKNYEHSICSVIWRWEIDLEPDLPEPRNGADLLSVAASPGDGGQGHSSGLADDLRSWEEHGD